ncbi:MAG: polyphenol oxidase family protein [Erysipelotrichaceae bacterium]|jgi:YfiH family protein|nr:polyphenol oxidase family protein [Erysipelotrichaceae bacterium]
MKQFVYHDFTQSIKGLTTTREGGFSSAPFMSFNLAYHVGDNDELVKKNRSLLLNELGIKEDHLILTYQTHSTVVKKVTRDDLGGGMNSFNTGIPADALYTYEKGVAIGVFHADCVPIMFCDSKRGLLGVIHASNQNSVQHFTKRCLEYLKQNENVNTEELLVYIGPYLSFSHNEIGTEARDQLLKQGFSKCLKETTGRIFLDTYFLNYLDLVDSGVLPERITVSPFCTFENPKLFFSVKNGAITGRMISLIINK